MHAAKVFDARSYSKGISKFLNVMPNISADYPKLFEWFSLVLLTLYNCKAFSFKDVTWFEKRRDDDDPMVEDYYRIAAHFLKRYSEQDSVQLS